MASIANLTASLLINVRSLGGPQLGTISSGLGGIAQAASRVSMNLSQFSANLERTAAGASRLKDMMLKITGAPLSAANDFEYAIAKVKGQMGFDTTGIDKLTAKAREMGKTTRFSAVQAAEGFESLTTLGFSVGQQMNMIDTVMNAASAGMMSTGDAAELAGATIHQFGLDAKDIPHTLDVLSSVAAASATDLRGMGEALKYVGPLAHTAGISLEGTAVMVGALANAGIDASQAGTSLRGMLAHMAKAAPLARKEMGALGLSIKSLKEGVSDPAKFLPEIEKAFEKNHFSKARKLESLVKIFGVEAAPAVAVLLEKLTQVGSDGKTGFDRLGDSVKDGDGFLKNFGKRLDETNQVKIEKMKNQFTDMLITVGAKFQPMVDRMGKELPGILDRLGPQFEKAFDKLPQAIERTVPKIVDLIGSLLRLTGKVSDFVDRHPRMLDAMLAIGAGAFTLTGLLGPIALAVSSVSGAFSLLSGSVGIIARVTSAVTGLGTAVVTAQAGTAAASTGIAGITAAASAALPVVAALGLALAAFYSFKTISDTAAPLPSLFDFDAIDKSGKKTKEDKKIRRMPKGEAPHSAENARIIEEDRKKARLKQEQEDIRTGKAPIRLMLPTKPVPQGQPSSLPQTAQVNQTTQVAPLPVPGQPMSLQDAIRRASEMAYKASEAATKIAEAQEKTIKVDSTVKLEDHRTTVTTQTPDKKTTKIQRTGGKDIGAR